MSSSRMCWTMCMRNRSARRASRRARRARRPRSAMPARNSSEAPDGRVARAPAAHVDEREAGQHDERAEAEGPGCVRRGCGRRQGRCRHARGLSQGVTPCNAPSGNVSVHARTTCSPSSSRRVCAACRSRCRGRAMSCARGCRRALPWLRRPAVRALRAAAHRRARVPGRAPAFDAAWAAVGYDGVGARPRRRAEVPPRGCPLADVMAAQLAAGAPPVAARGRRRSCRSPPHPRARAARAGYDQAELLAAALARRTGARLGRPLRRRGPRAQPLGASRAERLRAAGGSTSRVRGPAPARVVLVDDVHTTGATLDACARALHRAGAARGRRADLGARAPGRSPSAPTGSALTPATVPHHLSKGSKRLNGGASYADRGQGPEHPVTDELRELVERRFRKVAQPGLRPGRLEVELREERNPANPMRRSPT